MESPVCTPTGSTFSILQTVILFPLASRITSNSISFQPEIHFSTRICVIGDIRRPLDAISSISSTSCAIPPPVPPSVNAGRIITGYPISSANASADSRSFTTLEGMQGSPIESIVSLNICRSSALSIVSGRAPRRRTPWLSRNPSLASCMDRVRPVCPPRVDKILSGFSFSMIRFTVSSVRGSI